MGLVWVLCHIEQKCNYSVWDPDVSHIDINSSLSCQCTIEKKRLYWHGLFIFLEGMGGMFEPFDCSIQLDLFWTNILLIVPKIATKRKQWLCRPFFYQNEPFGIFKLHLFAKENPGFQSTQCLCLREWIQYNQEACCADLCLGATELPQI